VNPPPPIGGSFEALNAGKLLGLRDILDSSFMSQNFRPYRPLGKFRPIDSVSMDVIVINDHVADVDPHSEFDPRAVGNLFLLPSHQR
jgi:hypothetical protein